jgi:hypothetical protein
MSWPTIKIFEKSGEGCEVTYETPNQQVCQEIQVEYCQKGGRQKGDAADTGEERDAKTQEYLWGYISKQYTDR